MARKKNKAKGGQVADTDNQEEVVVPEPVIPQVADTGIALTEIKLAVENEDDETDQLLSVVEVVAKAEELIQAPIMKPVESDTPVRSIPTPATSDLLPPKQIPISAPRASKLSSLNDIFADVVPTPVVAAAGPTVTSAETEAEANEAAGAAVLAAFSNGPSASISVPATAAAKVKKQVQFNDVAFQDTNKQDEDALLQEEEPQELGLVDVADITADNMAMAMLTLGAGSINALTYRSFVDPKESRPNQDHYDNDLKKKRANQQELNNPAYRAISSRHVIEEDPLALPPSTQPKFGPWDGVFVSCLLNIFGVIMFLRLGWVVGQAGIGLSLLIVGVAACVTVCTSLSMSAICSNGQIKGGGAYYLLSRSLGPKIGGSIGCMFSLGMSVAVAMYTIGFCETIVEQLDGHFSFTDDKINDIRIWGLIILAILFIMALIGTGWVIKLQLGLLGLLVLSIISFFVGAIYKSDAKEGIVGYSEQVAKDNWGSDFRRTDGIDYDFFKVFAVFFPAVTGIMAGANISGDLKDPSSDIPKGTMWAVGVSTIVYAGMAVAAGTAVQREVFGSTTKGLVYDNLIMVKVSFFGPLVLAGIYAATFSSALASLVGAPRILQQIALDGIVPFLAPFAKCRVRDGSPIRGYCLAAVISGGCILIGELNIIAPLITMFFMLTYGLVNFACLALELTDSPGWRPTFTHFHWSTCLIGFILCPVIMFMTDVLQSIISLIITGAIYFSIGHKNVKTSWGSAQAARNDLKCAKMLMDLRQNDTHVKTYRPHFLVFCGEPTERPALIRFMDTLKLGRGISIFGKVIVGDYDELMMDEAANVEHRSGYYVDDERKIEGFMDTVVSPSLYVGMHSLIQCSGLGRLKPNICVIQFKEDYATAMPKDVAGYVQVLRDALRMRLGLILARRLDKINFDAPLYKEKNAEIAALAVPGTGDLSSTPEEAQLAGQKDGCIDIWWLVDDGGLCVLIPYLLSMHSFWKENTRGDNKSCKMRIMLVVENKKNVADLFRMIALMLANFRIKCDIEVIEAKKTPPARKTMELYEQYAVTPIAEDERPVVIRRWLRVAEFIAVASARASLVVCILPFPADSTHPSDYMSLLNCLSNVTPPMIFVRGNDTNVLTFESE